MYHAVTPVDVAVVGAGPAGSWTACLLARRGARVLLLDPSHPREKPCGGGVTARALEIVAPIVDVQTIPAVSIRSARFAASSTPVTVTVPLGADTLLVARRTEFDGSLLDAARQAGVRVAKTRVTDIQQGPNGFDIQTTVGVHRSRFLIGADGANSIVRRRLSSPFRRDQLSIATGFFAHGVTRDDIAIEFIGRPPGYVWSFPRPGHLAIGICAQADAGATSGWLRTVASSWIARTGIAEGARLESYSWPIPSLSATDFQTLKPSGPHWVFVGDAAGLVDPITREGIYFALLSAQCAADALTSAAPDPSSWYASAVQDSIGRDLARAARLKESFFKPQFTHLLIDALSHSPAIAAVMADLIAGRLKYGALKWRLVKTLEIGVGARLFLSGLRNRHELEHVGSAADPGSKPLKPGRY
ncbi:MAG: hypothetical protein C5B57_02605 [Blastocatellia bacterium]|nr:MAG: hypothetical protein C5B57_02605 [Blastocatellia bacterium]